MIHLDLIMYLVVLKIANNKVAYRVASRTWDMVAHW